LTSAAASGGALLRLCANVVYRRIGDALAIRML
jgi:hypothetical protein